MNIPAMGGIYLKALIVTLETPGSTAAFADIPWSDLGYQICGEASGYEDAIRSVSSFSPEVVLMQDSQEAMNFRESAAGMVSDICFVVCHNHQPETEQGIQKIRTCHVCNTDIHSGKAEVIDALRLLSQEKKDKIFRAHHGGQWLLSRFDRMLSSGDRMGLQDFFRHEFPSLELTLTDSRTLCIRLTEVLYRFLKTQNISVERLNASRERVLREIMAKRTRKSVEAYTGRLFLNVMQFQEKHFRKSGSETN